MNDNLPVKDIAAMSGVSVATVIWVINQNTEERIKENHFLLPVQIISRETTRISAIQVKILGRF
ncbi:MAG: hypothetical protein ACERKO_12320 [Acetanaerobacterium sp.]